MTKLSLFKDWKKAVLPSTSTIREVIENLNDIAIQIVLIADPGYKLLGTISDGDIRRGLLRGLGMDSGIDSVYRRDPLVVPESMDQELVLQLMTANQIRQIPIVDEKRQIVGLYLWELISDSKKRPNLMVIMAGGKGTRMHPHTENCPKPMLTIGGKPMLELIILRAISEGFNKFLISIHHLGHMIKEYFGSGEKWGVEISYLNEENPLGTAGALSLLDPRPDVPFLVTNGDVITDFHLSNIIEFHYRHQSEATMAVRLQEWQNPFGVLKLNGVKIVSFEEKPIVRNYINAGVYVLSPRTLDLLKYGEFCDMPTLFDRLNSLNMNIVAYPIHEHWMDVGRPQDLEFVNGINN
jgi:dTDP-glucose pyrophosphorylase